MSDCLIKVFSGCACPPGECAEKPTTPAPVTFVSWRTQAIACLAFGFLATIVTAAWMETQFKTRDLRNQEQVSWK
ncbi:hypothetical protein [Rhizobium ruizarguesonis]|uniref:Transmembrane protein n=1 Tax=Rhizobium ruizarguesonis TaxID=2081791 RepID=A0AAE8QAI5_9HYPH|nr:hypothetical protein [Rhizobium ruizarguesonis]TBY55564.1 hypothetical protein E0H46_36570 [Rhizobium leguminosarum bv. viciae]MBC2802689.1 hypothetical protein [Rhizobium ruizarguesonis]TAV04582.1 hypothetical protein ELI39_04410 [Rhizobium ruizarguesonis]TAW55543.1 hypothetical protein ELI17_03865 [Rhizobium ruizarguesonis]TBA79461.1 hypothetical protein ELH56_04010 [Rhizobium ruizarguesonis]